MLRDVIVGDWDRDGTQDLLVQSSLDMLAVHRGRGGCAFDGPSQTYATLATSTRIARGDLAVRPRQCCSRCRARVLPLPATARAS